MNKTKFLKPLFSIGAAALVAIAFSAAPASASTINAGSTVTFVFGTPKLNGGTNLSNTSGLLSLSDLRTANCTPDFCVVPDGTDLAIKPGLLLASINAGGGFTFPTAQFGNFTVTSGSVDAQTPTGLLATLNGTLSGFGGFDPTPAIITFAFTQSGTGLAGTAALSVVANPVPEPGTMALLGGSLLGLAAFGRRRLAAKR